MLIGIVHHWVTESVTGLMEIEM